jgi:hypothetical protein
MLDALEAYTAIPYPYPKLDLVAVPRVGWAMENPGLVTFDQQFLEDPAQTSTIAHEMAHQWFGDYVTQRWWDDIWLSESFAGWLGEKVTRQLAGEGPVDRWVNASFSFAQRVRVRPTVKDNDSLTFDRFSPHEAISKGAAVLAFLESSLGEERFRDALRSYLRAHVHGTATTADLAAALGAATGTSFGPLLDEMLDDIAPTLEANLVCGAHPHVHFEIEVDVPVCIAYDHTGKRVDACTTVAAKSSDVPLPACPHWLMIGATGLAPYAIAWTPALAKPLLKHWSELSPVEHRLLFSDLEDAAPKLEAFVKLVAHNEAAPTVAEARFLSSIADYVPDDLHPSFDAWVQGRYRQFVHRLGHEERATYDESVFAELLAIADDPTLAHEAASPTGGRSLYAFTILTLRANHDLAFACQLADRSRWDQPSSRSLYARALAWSRSLPKLVKTAPEKIVALGRSTSAVFEHTCDAATRSNLAALAQANPSATELAGAVVQIDHCLATKAKLAPLFRAWLQSGKAP